MLYITSPRPDREADKTQKSPHFTDEETEIREAILNQDSNSSQSTWYDAVLHLG